MPGKNVQHYVMCLLPRHCGQTELVTVHGCRLLKIRFSPADLSIPP